MPELRSVRTQKRDAFGPNYDRCAHRRVTPFSFGCVKYNVLSTQNELAQITIGANSKEKRAMPELWSVRTPIELGHALFRGKM